MLKYLLYTNLGKMLKSLEALCGTEKTAYTIPKKLKFPIIRSCRCIHLKNIFHGTVAQQTVRRCIVFDEARVLQVTAVWLQEHQLAV